MLYCITVSEAHWSTIASTYFSLILPEGCMLAAVALLHISDWLQISLIHALLMVQEQERLSKTAILYKAFAQKWHILYPFMCHWPK